MVGGERAVARSPSLSHNPSGAADVSWSIILTIIVHP